jgi:hypothetical protein
MNVDVNVYFWCWRSCRSAGASASVGLGAANDDGTPQRSSRPSSRVGPTGSFGVIPNDADGCVRRRL